MIGFIGGGVTGPIGGMGVIGGTGAGDGVVPGGVGIGAGVGKEGAWASRTAATPMLMTPEITAITLRVFLYVFIPL